eukprot:3834521-Karenia_brevis.AAC.1
MIALQCHQHGKVWLKVKNDVVDVSCVAKTLERVIDQLNILDLPLIAACFDLRWYPILLIQL